MYHLTRQRAAMSNFSKINEFHISKQSGVRPRTHTFHENSKRFALFRVVCYLASY